ncbi:MAG: transcription factor [Candidatus Bathyarchaeota archaeon]|jgi:transcription initiation factor TFIIE subunit alpha
MSSNRDTVIAMSLYSNVSDETIDQIARILGGEEGVEIINVIKDVDEITVEEIAEKTEIQINDVRKILYRFYNHSLVASRRYRDKETGWFIFQWSLQPELIEGYLNGIKQKILKKLEARLQYELDHEFYHCGKETCMRITFEEAMDTVFNCPVCGEPVKPVDNEEYIVFLEKKIEEIKGELEE